MVRVSEGYNVTIHKTLAHTVQVEISPSPFKGGREGLFFLGGREGRKQLQYYSYTVFLAPYIFFLKPVFNLLLQRTERGDYLFQCSLE